jgi:hypothetical protein
MELETMCDMTCIIPEVLAQRMLGSGNKCVAELQLKSTVLKALEKLLIMVTFAVIPIMRINLPFIFVRSLTELRFS